MELLVSSIRGWFPIAVLLLLKNMLLTVVLHARLSSLPCKDSRDAEFIELLSAIRLSRVFSPAIEARVLCMDFLTLWLLAWLIIGVWQAIEAVVAGGAGGIPKQIGHTKKHSVDFSATVTFWR